MSSTEHARVKRATVDARNASARGRRLQTQRGLFLSLPGVVSWQRPREQPLRGGGRRTAYPPAYADAREKWRLVVQSRVFASGWVRPPVAEALGVVLHVIAPGKLDLDRVATAVLDALQGGGALVDDCRVTKLFAERRRPWADEAAHVDVLLTTVEAGVAVPGLQGAS